MPFLKPNESEREADPAFGKRCGLFHLGSNMLEESRGQDCPQNVPVGTPFHKSSGRKLAA
jgi:hypothetical protein